ncbi:protein [Escherichia coli]|nr:protein [Escherichia coli]
MKRLIMATMVTAILASSTVWAADNAPVAAQQQTQQVQQTQKTAAAAERISEQGLYAMRDVQVARLALFHGDPEKAKELTNEASACCQMTVPNGQSSLSQVKRPISMMTNILSLMHLSEFLRVM